MFSEAVKPTSLSHGRGTAAKTPQSRCSERRSLRFVPELKAGLPSCKGLFSVKGAPPQVLVCFQVFLRKCEEEREGFGSINLLHSNELLEGRHSWIWRYSFSYSTLLIELLVFWSLGVNGFTENMFRPARECCDWRRPPASWSDRTLLTTSLSPDAKFCLQFTLICPYLTSVRSAVEKGEE
jgi:hypothetical protein